MTLNGDACRRRGTTGDIVRALAVAAAAMIVPQAAHAQNTIVLPPSHAAIEGSSSTNVPFGRSGPMRTQIAYGGHLFAGVTTMTGLAFRLDGAATEVGKQVDVEVRMSTMTYGVPAIQPFFSSNRGADETVVFDRKNVQLPAGSAQSPAPFSTQLPFDRTFTYDPAAGAAVLIEIIVHGQQVGTFSLDATFLCTSGFEYFGPAGCGSLQLNIPTAQVMWGRPAFIELSGVVPGTLTGLMLGSQEGGTWAGLSLPFDLASIGAPGCYVSTNLLAGFGMNADANGQAMYRLQIPSMPRLQNAWLHFQGLAADPLANPLGVVTSQAAKVEICGWEPVSRVYAPSLTANSGFREIGVAPVIELTTR